MHQLTGLKGFGQNLTNWYYHIKYYNAIALALATYIKLKICNKKQKCSKSVPAKKLKQL